VVEDPSKSSIDVVAMLKDVSNQESNVESPEVPEVPEECSGIVDWRASIWVVPF
jgi:hypothetical protein